MKRAGTVLWCMQELSESLGVETDVSGAGTPREKTTGTENLNPYITIDIGYCCIVIGPNLGFNCSDVLVEVAELLRAYWLEVHGVFETGYLTPGTKYEVSYVIKMKEPSSGWDDKVDFSLTLPQNPTRGLNINKTDLKQISRDDWISIRVDEFTSGQSGKMDFMLRQPGRLKTGLVIKGVTIRPTT